MITYHEAQLRPEETTVLVRHALNQLWMGNQDEGCCPRCCAPCSVLQELLITDRLDVLLRYPEPAETWWDTNLHQVDRAFLLSAWRLQACHNG